MLDLQYEHFRLQVDLSGSRLTAYSALFDHGLAAFFKVVVAFCNKITLCSLFFWIQVDF